MITTSIRCNSRLWIVSTIILIVLQVIFPYRGWMMLLIGIGGILLISYLWALSLKKNLRLQRWMRFGWAHIGDILEEKFVLENLSDFPCLWVEILAETTIPGYDVSRATGIGAHAENTWTTRQICSHRGLYTLGPTRIRTGDPFDVFTVTIIDQSTANILVTPPVFPLPSIQIAPGDKTGEERSRQRSFGESVTSSGIRGYLPGDSLHRIAWKVSAQRNDLFVKTFETVRSSDWWIILDLCRANQITTPDYSSEETGVIFAASLAEQGYQKGTSVGLVVNCADPVWLYPSRRNDQTLEILHLLAQVSPRDIDLAQFLTTISRDIPSRTSVSIVTADPDPAWVQPLLQIYRNGIAVTVLLLDSPSGTNLTSPIDDWLTDLGILIYHIPSNIFDLKLISDEAANKWEWKISPTGKAIPTRLPADTKWKPLS